MTKFDKEYKVNFVDKNNVFVGFDTYQSCCEDFGYVLTEEENCEDLGEAKETNLAELNEYVFDTKYFKEGDAGEDEGGVVCFKLYSECHSHLPPVFLYLYNFHNGYYGHGFEANIGGLQWQEGSI